MPKRGDQSIDKEEGVKPIFLSISLTHLDLPLEEKGDKNNANIPKELEAQYEPKAQEQEDQGEMA